jgi:hypothetical protein
VQKLSLLFVSMLVLIYFRVAASTTELIAPNKHNTHGRILLTDTTKTKPTLIIDNPFFVENQDDSKSLLHVNVLLVNNQANAVKFIGTTCQFSRLFKVDNHNMVLVDCDCGTGGLVHFTIPPHSAFGTRLVFRFIKSPGRKFQFKIGMRLLASPGSYSQSNVDSTVLNNTNFVWSETEQFQTSRVSSLYGRDLTQDNKIISGKWFPVYYPLTEEDRRNYTLSIDGAAVGKPHDTVTYGMNMRGVTSLPLRLTNNSNDTLKYMNMTCSWFDAYILNVDNVRVLPHDCDANFPTDFRLPPHQWVMVNLPVSVEESAGLKSIRFKIGMSLQKFTGQPPLDDFERFYNKISLETGNMIWSNEVELP